ncbi:hypothetical protein VTJ49DRAFT_1886 [Mycothermus thermophilus]|uniref:Uncharacterized protein n=1 Tax=Humicola insolens TaxID=85995 RepID=A0ABR3VB67_HUMIN
MATVSPLSQRTEFFQQLKRVCVPLSHHALAPEDKPVDPKAVLGLLETLIGLWTTQAGKDATILDEKLADYVFFPLSHMLKVRDRYPIRVTEAVVRLLRELIQYGWKAKASPQLVRELLIFISVLLGGIPSQPKKDIPEELTIEGFRALAALVSVAQPSYLVQPRDSPSDGKTSPLPYAIEVTLDGITEETVAAVQLEALNALRAILTTVKDNAVLAQFLPGTVSALTKVLAPPRANSAPAAPELLTPSWLKATSAQVKIALSAVLKLRGHDSDDVQEALHKFCIGLLDECHASLTNCRLILVETAMMLEEQDAVRSPLQTSLQDLAGVYPELGDSIKSALYNWITGLPRVMQSADERVKELAVRSILRGSNLAAALRMDSSTLEDALGDSLRDSIVTLIKSSKLPKIVDDVAVDMVGSSTELVKPGMEMAGYGPVLLNSVSEKTTREAIGTLVARIGSTAQQVKLATTMLGYVRDCDGVDQIASFWLAFELLKSAYSQSSDMDELFDLSSLGESQLQEEAFRELYEFSASLLSAHSDTEEQDWRLEAIALEVSAFAASRLKADFRPELIDVLYPITTFLGSAIPQLRQHAITTLNVIAACCGYKSVSDLIIENADYMVNSISLRLNTFDISPASTKVLTMVIRLTGPRLLPFLDDVVSAIFAALDNYHGYPIFVESLFSVLSEVVTQGVKSDKLLLEDANHTAIDHRKKPPTSLGIPGILDTLSKRLERAARTAEEDALPFESHPKKPWGPPKDQAKSLLDKLTNPDPSSEDNDDDDNEATDNNNTRDLEKPKTPTYTLLTHILSLTQHYLTSPTPTLRKSLLDIITTVSPALAPDENAFLPLVHAVWPVVFSRLYDAEGYVQIAACHSLAALCKAAGDFLSTRFKTEWEGKMKRWAGRVKGEAEKVKAQGRGGGGGGRGGLLTKGARDGGILIPVAGADGEKVVKRVGGSSTASSELTTPGSLVPGAGAGGGALGRFAQTWQIWEAVLGLLAAIVGYVRIDDGMFDEILALGADALPRHEELREAMEAVNSDAVWLAMYERGMVKVEREPEVVKGWEFGFAPLRVGGSA